MIILDVVGDKKKLGKSGSDLKNKKLTFVSLYGIDKSQKIADKYFNQAMNILKTIKARNKESKEILEKLTIFILRREK